MWGTPLFNEPRAFIGIVGIFTELEALDVPGAINRAGRW